MNFNSKNRTHRIMVWVSDEEKTLLETKADYYCYKSFAAYIRDAAIYEKVTKVDMIQIEYVMPTQIIQRK